MTEDEDDKIQKEYAVEGVKAENVEQIYLKTNLRCAVVMLAAPMGRSVCVVFSVLRRA